MWMVSTGEVVKPIPAKPYVSMLFERVVWEEGCTVSAMWVDVDKVALSMIYPNEKVKQYIFTQSPDPFRLSGTTVVFQPLTPQLGRVTLLEYEATRQTTVAMRNLLVEFPEPVKTVQCVEDLVPSTLYLMSVDGTFKTCIELEKEHEWSTSPIHQLMFESYTTTLPKDEQMEIRSLSDKHSFSLIVGDHLVCEFHNC